MNIAIFTNNYIPNLYGVTQSIETFRREFEKRGHSVFIFAPYFRDYQDKNPYVFRYPSLDIKIKFRFPLPLPYSSRMDKIIENLNLDIIHVQHPNLLGTTGKKWAQRKKIPLIFTWHTLYDQYTNFIPFLPAKTSANFMVKGAVQMANQSDVVVIPTDSIRAILKKWGVQRKMISVATGVEEEDFSKADKNIIRKKYSLSRDEIVLLIVSRLTAEKNVEFVFRSVENILKKQPVRLLIVGNGYLKSKLEKFSQRTGIKKKVIFCGEIKREKIKHYYAGADIFIYGSQSETQGMVITEAMYMGLPIVAVRATGINSLVVDNKNGFLVSESEKEFEKAVKKLVMSSDLRQRLGFVSQEIAKNKFTATVGAEKMLQVYQNAIKNKRK